MNFFVFPEVWIKAAILAAVSAFGSIDHSVHVEYAKLPPRAVLAVAPPDTIIVAKRKHWSREEAQCLIAHGYGHLAGRKHSRNPDSIMFPEYRAQTCHRWLVKHLP